MWHHDATEVAYKNGFEDGLMKSKEEIDRLKHTIRVLEIALSNALQIDYNYTDAYEKAEKELVKLDEIIETK